MIRVPAELLILGSGTSSGVPLIGCSCPVCSSSDFRDNRTRASALLRCDDSVILIDTATDLRQQVLREKVDRIDSVLYTHVHADHVNGIDDLRAFNNSDRRSLPVYGAKPTIESIRQSFGYIFDPAEKSYKPDLELIAVDSDFDVCGIRLVPVLLEHGSSEVFGYRTGDLAYLTDCSGIPDSSWSLIEGVKTLVIDGLRYKSHASHFNISEAIAVGQRCGAQRTVLTHLSHDVHHAEHSVKLPDGVEFAYDGQVIDVLVDKIPQEDMD